MMALQQQSPAAAHWSQQQYENLFEWERVSQASTRFSWIVEGDEPPGIMGFLVSHPIDQEWELENIVVAEPARRRGVGTLLLSELIAYARSNGGVGIFLEVRESNVSARALYRKLGFGERGLRKNYYSNPAEHGVLYHFKL
jgi:[ribosomal protein S18]-alanine N-acetyltransferase